MERKSKIGIILLIICLLISMLISIYYNFNYLIDRYIPLVHSKPLYIKDAHSLSFNNYYEYYFNENQDYFFKNNKYYGKVIPENFDRYRAYFADIIEYFKYNNNKEIENITYNDGIIKENDYIYIETLEGKKKNNGEIYGMFDCYTLYYYDTSTHILYCIDKS